MREEEEEARQRRGILSIAGRNKGTQSIRGKWPPPASGRRIVGMSEFPRSIFPRTLPGEPLQ